MTVQVGIQAENYQLRDATPEDLPAIVAIYNQGVGRAHAYLEPVTVASRQAWFSAHGHARPLMVLTDVDGNMAAWVSLSDLYPAPAYYLSAEISLYVASQFCGQGLGGYLLQAMLVRAADIGVVNVIAKVFAHNQASLALFKKHAFDTWGILPKVCLSQGVLSDVVILGRCVGAHNLTDCHD